MLKIFMFIIKENVGRVYHLKEKRLAHFLVSVLGLEGSSRAGDLSKWNDIGDLSLIIYNLIQDSVLYHNSIIRSFINYYYSQIFSIIVL